MRSRTPAALLCVIKSEWPEVRSALQNKFPAAPWASNRPRLIFMLNIFSPPPQQCRVFFPRAIIRFFPSTSMLFCVDFIGLAEGAVEIVSEVCARAM